MKAILTCAIKLYWRFWPQQRRRACLFRESCSHHVYRMVQEKGLVSGVRALGTRFRACRKGYVIVPIRNGYGVQLVDGTIISSDEASSILFEPLQNTVNEAQSRLLNKL